MYNKSGRRDNYPGDEIEMIVLDYYVVAGRVNKYIDRIIGEEFVRKLELTHVMLHCPLRSLVI